MSGLDQLVEMGFPKDRAEKALSCNNNNVEQAMEWLLVHAEDDLSNVNPPNEPKPVEIKNDESSADDKSETTPSTSETAQEAKSIKCEDCGKLFKTTIEIEFHAAKSGHSNFSESTEEKKPLTEEEKKAQLAQLEERIKAKRLEREEKEKQEALEKERLRIKSGKDMSEAKRRLEEEEMKKIVEQRKREKQEEKLARERVKAQIEADKAARRAKAAGQPPTSEPAPTPSVSVQPSQVTSPPKDYKETKIQIRLPNGTTLVETFDKREQLSAVRLFVQLKQGNEPGTFPFGMMTSFPKKVFSEEDFEKSLDELKLVPSAVIIVTKVA